LSNVAVAERVGVNPATVLKWRKRFLARRLDGLIDEPRPAPRRITDADVEAVVVRTLDTIDAAVPDGLNVHVVLDNSPPTRHRPSTPGCCATYGSRSTSPRPARRGSTSSDAGSLS